MRGLGSGASGKRHHGVTACRVPLIIPRSQLPIVSDLRVRAND